MSTDVVICSVEFDDAGEVGDVVLGAPQEPVGRTAARDDSGDVGTGYWIDAVPGRLA
jgi:hypothetical protein